MTNFRVAYCVLFAAGAVGFALAGYAYFFWDDEPGATVEEPDREFVNLSVGRNDVSFPFHNPTRHKVRVVGYQFC